MALTVKYRTTRADIWRLYWCLWRARLWRTQVVLFLAVVGIVLLLGGIPGDATGWLRLPAYALTLPAFLILYPQLRFKPQQRTLTIDEAGIRSKIGGRTGSRAWATIRSVTESRGRIVIVGHGGNAFIIPPEAFATPEERARFRIAAEQWRTETS